MTRSAERGFTLVEALVALALLTVVLLSGLGLLVNESRIERRLAASAAAMRAVEATLEGLRAGTVPLRGGPVAPPAGAATGAGRPLVWLEVTPSACPDLYDVRAIAHYTVLAEERHWEARTLVWAP